MRVLSVSALRGVFVKDEVRGLGSLGIQVDLVMKKSTTRFAYIPFMVRTVLKLVRPDYDLVHAHFVPHSALLPAILKTKPLIVTFHGSDANVFPWKSESRFLLTRFVIGRSDMVIAVSNDIKSTLVDRLGIDQDKIEVIHCCGVDTGLFRPISKQLASKLTGLTAKHVVLFVGNLLREKGVEDIFTVARQMPDVLFVLIGPGQLTILPKNCLVLNEKKHEELPPWMSAADVLILPSRSEGAPSVILESLACGTPVIVSDVGGCGEQVTSSRTGFLIPVGDVASLAERISYLLSNERVRVEMGKKGREDMLARYEQIRLVKELAKVYEAVLQKSNEQQ